MKEKILMVFNEEQQTWSFSELKNRFNGSKEDELKRVLSALEEEGIIYLSKKKRYLLLKNTGLKKGELIVNKKGFGFVDIEAEENDIFIARDNMGDAIHNDTVIVEVSEEHPGKKEGRIIKILKRNSDSFVGEFCLDEKEHGYIELDDAKVKIRIIIPDEFRSGAMPGHKVLVKMLEKRGKGIFEGKVQKILGHKEDPGVDILSIVYKYNIDDNFDGKVMAEVEEVSEEVSEAEIARRTDLRSNQIITIDGDDAKDLDDAISIEKLENGNYKLGVHIADVSHYVKKDMAIDETAYDRGTSVYLTDRVIPMLPHKLSNGICSLNELVNRLTVSCEMEIDERGTVVNYEIIEAVINSKKRMTYKAVNKVIEDNEVPKGYENFVPMLKEMKELSGIIRKSKEKRGQIDFDTEEAKIIVDELGKPVEIQKRVRGTAEKMIEDFMIIANETVASYFFYKELPAVYRIHDKPDAEKINSFVRFVSILGYDIKGLTKKLHSKELQGVLEQLKDKKEYGILSMLLLRSMKKAIYDPNNIGHYGLGSKCYCHFTSPIRRYPDTTIHRLLREFIFDKKVDDSNKNYWEKYLIPMTLHASSKERSAVDCEREVDDMKKAEYMMDYIGEEYDGIISSVMKFGLFVELPNTVEGLIHIAEMDDFYEYDEITMSLVGRRKKKRYRIGDKLKIKVTAASKEEKKVDFAIVEKIEEK